MSQTVIFEQNKPMARQVIDLIAGQTEVVICNYLFGNPTSPSAAAFRNSNGVGFGRTVTSTVFPVNSPSASGSQVTLSPMTGLLGPAEYIVEVSATVNSVSDKHQFRVRVKKAGAF